MTFATGGKRWQTNVLPTSYQRPANVLPTSCQRPTSYQRPTNVLTTSYVGRLLLTYDSSLIHNFLPVHDMRRVGGSVDHFSFDLKWSRSQNIVSSRRALLMRNPFGNGRGLAGSGGRCATSLLYSLIILSTFFVRNCTVRTRAADSFEPNN